MSDRLPSDHPSVTTLRASLARSGGTRRPCLRLPDEAREGVDAGAFVRLVLDGTDRHARVAADDRGLLVRGAYDTKPAARARDGPNRLVEWADAHGRAPGDAVELDVLDAGFQYGLRVPGERVVYTTTDRPDASLSAIADRLDGDRDDDTRL
jgi:hypothetical protein